MGLIILRVCSVSVEAGSLLLGVPDVNSSLSWCVSWKISFSGTIFLSFGKGSKPGASFDGKACFNGGGGGLLSVGLKPLSFPPVDSGEDGFSRGNVLGTFGGNFLRKKLWRSSFWKSSFGEVAESSWSLSCLGENALRLSGFSGFSGDNWTGDVLAISLSTGFSDSPEGESSFSLTIWLSSLPCSSFESFAGCTVSSAQSLFCCSSRSTSQLCLGRSRAYRFWLIRWGGVDLSLSFSFSSLFLLVFPIRFSFLPMSFLPLSSTKLLAESERALASWALSQLSEPAVPMAATSSEASALRRSSFGDGDRLSVHPLLSSFPSSRKLSLKLADSVSLSREGWVGDPPEVIKPSSMLGVSFKSSLLSSACTVIWHASLLLVCDASSSLSESTCLALLLVDASFTIERAFPPLDFRRGLWKTNLWTFLLVFDFFRFFFFIFPRAGGVRLSDSLSSPASDIPSTFESSDSLVTFSEFCSALNDSFWSVPFSCFPELSISMTSAFSCIVCWSEVSPLWANSSCLRSLSNHPLSLESVNFAVFISDDVTRPVPASVSPFLMSFSLSFSL